MTPADVIKTRLQVRISFYSLKFNKVSVILVLKEKLVTGYGEVSYELRDRRLI